MPDWRYVFFSLGLFLRQDFASQFVRYLLLKPCGQRNG